MKPYDTTNKGRLERTLHTFLAVVGILAILGWVYLLLESLQNKAPHDSHSDQRN